MIHRRGCAALVVLLAMVLPARANNSAAATARPAPIPTGSLLVLTNSNKLVARWTSAEVTHVAIAVEEDGHVWVYEATPSKVRRIALAEYREELAEQNRSRTTPMALWVMTPDRPFDKREQLVMQRYLDAQLGRRYSIKNYVRSRPGDGIHCAELASSALQQTGRYLFGPHYAISPARLVKVLEHTYDEPSALALPRPIKNESWCQRSWKWWGGWADWC